MAMGGTDLELLQRYAESRDAQAFAELVARNRDMVYGACYRALGGQVDAEDAAQECFLELARRAGSVKTSVAGWLHRVAVRTALAMQRKSRARSRAEREAATMLAGSEAEATWDEVKAEIDKAIDRLPERLREPLVLHFLQGRTQTAIAEEIGLSQSVVSVRVKEAIERLRGHLKRTGLAVTAAGLATLLQTHGVEAAPATLVASLGKIALAGVAPSGSTGVAVPVLGHIALAGPAAKISCVVVTSLAVALGARHAVESRRGPPQPASIAREAPRSLANAVPITRSLDTTHAAREPTGQPVGDVMWPQDGPVPTASVERDAADLLHTTDAPIPQGAAIGSTPTHKHPADRGARPTRVASATTERTRVAQAPEEAGPEAATGQDAVAEGPAVDTSASLAALQLPSLRYFFAQPRPPPLRDFEGVWIDLRAGEDAHGLEWLDGWQCSRKMGEAGGVQCAQTDLQAGGQYLLFEAHWDMIVPDRDTLTFEVEYFDSGRFPLILQVESALPTVAGAEVYWRGAPTKWREDTRTWRRARWQVTDEAFCDIARGKIRFRLHDQGWRGDRTLSVSYVRVTHEALCFRPQSEVLLCNQRMSVAMEAYDPVGEPLPDGTEAALSCEPEDSLAALPQSVTLTDGRATLDLQAGAEPGTAWLTARTETLTARSALHILAGKGEIVERTDLASGEDLADRAEFVGRNVAESTIDTFTDDQGQVVLCAQFVRKPNAGEVDLRLGLPIAGFPKRLCVHMGCPDESIETVWAEIVDRDGEVFPYALEQLGGGPLPHFADRRLDCRASPGPTWNERTWDGQGTNGVIDPPCTLRTLRLTPSAGLDQGQLHVWGVEVDVLAPAENDAAG